MATTARKLHDDVFLSHIQTCSDHDTRNWRLCWGELKRGGICNKRTVTGAVIELLPVCRTHQGHKIRPAVCSAILDCGFQCGQLFKWEPHGFALCPQHEHRPMPCYLLQIPVELRFRIFEYLLPDKEIPTFHANRPVSFLRNDGSLVQTAFLRTNRQIHDEGVDILYGRTTFCIAVESTSISMCKQTYVAHSTWLNRTGYQYQLTPALGTHALRDYQLQLMLLEQQNRQRRQMVVQGANWTIPTLGYDAAPAQNPASQEEPMGPFGPIWQPSLRARYFDMIRSFHVNITLPSHDHNAQRGVSHSSSMEINENRLYETCDQLHKLLGRLEVVKPSILKLQVSITIDEFDTIEETLPAAQLLLRPFRRLRQIVSPSVHVIWKTLDHPLYQKSIHFSSRELGMQMEDTPFQGFMRRWISDLSRNTPPAEPSPAVHAYWYFRGALREIMCSRYHALYSTLELEGFLKRARVAREADDFVGLQATIDEFSVKWAGYVKDQKCLEQRVSQSINSVIGMLRHDVQEPLLSPLAETNKGKGKVEDAEAASLSWTDLDGTIYTQVDGKLKVPLLTPSLIRERGKLR